MSNNLALPRIKLISSYSDLLQACQSLSAQPAIGYDIETTSLDPYLGKIRLIQLSDGQTTYIIDLFATPNLAVGPLEKLLTGPVVKVIHNALFDCKWTKHHLGVEIRNIFCTMLNSQILACGKGDRNHNLAEVLQYFLGYTVDKTQQKSDWSVPRLDMEQIEYAARDAAVLPRLYDEQVRRLSELDLVDVSILENECVPAIVDMELAGIYLDPVAWRDHLEELEKQRDKLEKELQVDLLDPNGFLSFFGRADINISSPTQVLDAFEALGIPVGDSLEAWKIEPLAPDYPVISKYLDYKATDKVLTSFGENILNLIHPVTGRLHPSVRQLGAITTGRFSQSNPNCFPPEVEILTEAGWTRFDRLKEEERVATFSTTTEVITFDRPTAYIQQDFNGPLAHLHGVQQVNILATPDHDVLLSTRKGRWLKVPASSVPPDHKILQAGTVVKGGASLSEWEVGLWCAIQADGHIDKYGSLDIKFARQRKIDRFRRILSELKIPFTESSKTYAAPQHNDQIRFRVAATDLPSFVSKEFTWGILSFDSSTLHQFATEIFQWDGESVRASAYTSKNKSNCDIVQALLTLTGRRANVRKRTVDSRDYWDVYVSNRAHSMTTNLTTEQVPYTGKVYCVTVPSGNIVTRYNGRVAIIGNCQQWPSDEASRSAIKAGPGKKLVIADYSQIELRILADRSQDPVFIEAFRSGADFHKQTAAAVNGVALEDVTEEQRSFAKRLNFGIVYGVGPKKFALLNNMSESYAETHMRAYFEKLPGLNRYLRDEGRTAVAIRESRTASGRLLKLHYDENKRGEVGAAKRNGVNQPIQGTSADILKRALALLHQSMKGTSGRLVNIVHDEILTECDAHEADLIAEKLTNSMIQAGEEYVKNVPIVVDPVITEAWRKK